MASTSTVLARLAQNASTSFVGSSVLSSLRTPSLRRSFVYIAQKRNGFPHARQLFPSELLLPRVSSLGRVNNFSTSSSYYSPAVAEALSEEADVEPSETIPDSSVPFSELEGKIHPNTLKAITVRPFKHTHLSPVQEQILPLLPELALTTEEAAGSKTARDLLVKAKTGTGKTMAFLVPAIESRLNAIKKHVEAKVEEMTSQGITVTATDKARLEHNYAVENAGVLIISPTRELATQIAVEAMNLTTHHRGFGVQVILGGESRGRQLRQWRGRKDIIVATPGRVIDLLESEESVSQAMKSTKLLVLDEADTLLDMGFQPDIVRISSYLPKTSERQTFLFSATVSRKVEEIARVTLSSKYRYINCVSSDDSPVHAHIPQYHTVLPSGEHALPHLLRVIAHDQLTKQKEGTKSKIIIFFSTTKMVQIFSELLRMSAISLPCGRQTTIYEMHSKKDMDRRISTSRNFRQDDGPGSILVTSDVSARGVDYPGVTRVVQMGLPASKEMYIHRVGRTGRGNSKEGRGDLVISPWEMGFLQSRMKDVGLVPVTVDGIKGEVEELAKELADSTPAAKLIPGRTSSLGHRMPTARSYLPTFSTLDSAAGAATSSIGGQEYSETYMSQLGFYLGHTEELGLRLNEVADGLGRYFQQMGALEGPPAMSRAMAERLQMGSAKRQRGGQRSKNPAWGTFATGSNNRGLGRNEGRRSSWESGGSGFRGEVGSQRDRQPPRFRERSEGGSDGGYRGSSRGSGSGDWATEKRSGSSGRSGPHWSGRGHVSSRSPRDFKSRD
ncbi:P-loop containing nucleoside triphosphate hydrolase protein [Crepidotus variabilis]|uniref:ATP-dependent RNA helicase n=1 Tax=Crepidotus variabilis TaxID=179855 RepID=A0A9P6EE88_9AGAR|nr:P-loop containing nucleoside triphosphate hydrolase protein [Crepidotus variabilis]